MPRKTVPTQVAADHTLQLFLRRVARVRPAIQQVILFGSRARGDALPDSDYDLLLVVPVRTAGLLDTLYEAVIDTLLATGRLISLKIYTASEYARLSDLATPLMRRIQTEGVPVA